MRISIGERIGAALAFIPVVSTVVGVIKAINYSKREAQHLAEKVNGIAEQQFNRKIAQCESDLFMVSLVEMIPLVNITAASVELWLLSKLSNERDLAVSQEAVAINVPTLELSEDELRAFNEESLCKKIEESGAKALAIHTPSGEIITYNQHVLEQLLFRLMHGTDPKLKIDDLTEFCKAQCTDGEHTDTRAMLLLSGDVFRDLFEELSNTKEIILPITLRGFQTVLADVQRGDLTLKRLEPILGPLKAKKSKDRNFLISKDPSGPVSDVEFLRFPPEFFMPKGLIGQKELETYLGKVDPVPPPTRELLEAIRSGEITTETHIVMWIPPRVDGEPLTLNRAEQLIKSKNGIGFEKDWSHIPETIGNQLMHGGYWLVMQKNLIQGTANMTYEQADDFVTQNFPGYEILDTGDVALSAFMNNLCSEKKERILDRQDLVRYTWCKGSTQNEFGTWYMVVGAFAPSGLTVDLLYYDRLARVGLLCGRKFC